MALEGSRLCPYLLSDFNSMVNLGNWQGGWVQHEENVIIYHSENLSTCSCTGSRTNPIPEYFYSEMRDNEIWLGGWVARTNAIKYYYDIDGIQYGIDLGEEYYPCPISIFNEMAANGIWEGGWVQDFNGTVRYVQNFSANLISGDGCGCGSSGNGSGSGSGSGDGSGCGCDGSGCGCDGGGSGSDGGDCGSGSNPKITICPITEGEEEYAAVISLPGGAVIDVKISWTEGGTSGLYNLSEANVTLSIKDHNYSISYNNICTSWDGAYIMGIRGNFGVQYLVYSPVGYAISATYEIPAQYR